jgi:hypothetical protein
MKTMIPRFESGKEKMGEKEREGGRAGKKSR